MLQYPIKKYQMKDLSSNGNCPLSLWTCTVHVHPGVKSGRSITELSSAPWHPDCVLPDPISVFLSITASPTHIQQRRRTNEECQLLFFDLINHTAVASHSSSIHTVSNWDRGWAQFTQVTQQLKSALGKLRPHTLPPSYDGNPAGRF